jgi:hypothetical protein
LENGSTVINGTEALLAHATDYYKTLFGPVEGNLFELELDIWGEDECVNSLDNQELTNLFLKRK